MPSDMAVRAEQSGVRRVATDHLTVLVLSVMGGAFIVANAYFIPMGLFIKTGASDTFWNPIGKTAADFPDLNWTNFLGNLIPVTVGNIIGGSLLVGVVYWFVYLRRPKQDENRRQSTR